MLGYAEHEIGSGLEEWDGRIHPDDKEKVYADLNAHLEGKTPYYQNTHRVLCKDGSYKWILDRGKVVDRTKDGKPLRVIGTHTDVSEARKIEEELRDANARLDMAQELAQIGNWEWDKNSGEVFWSEEVYRIFGKDPDGAGPSFDDYMLFTHPADIERLIATIDNSLRTSTPYRIEHRIIQSDGRIKHINAVGRVLPDDDGRAKGMMGTVQDITERKQAEEALRANEERMRAMAEASYDALIVIDADDTISFWSPAAETMFGWSKEEVIGQKMHPLITPEKYHQQIYEGLKQFRHTGQGPLIGTIQEFEAIRKSGEIFPVERSAASFKLGDSYLAVGSLRDITTRKRIEQELRSYADRLTLASKAGGIGVWEWNVKTDTLQWDDRMFQLYSVEPGEFSGLYEAWRNRLHPDDLANAEKALQHAVEKSSSWDWEFRIVRPNGETAYIKAAALVQMDKNNEPELVIGVNWDVTEARVQAEQLRLLATTDDMTKLYNRRRFIELVEQEMERSRRYANPFALIMFDADKFKAVNDTYGHDVGDMVLKAIASTAKNELRDVDILGRIGGEEFAACLPETDADHAATAAERLRAAMEEAYVEIHDGTRVRFTVSLGVAVPDASCKDVDTLLKYADLALYKAKEKGRNRVELYTPDQA